MSPPNPSKTILFAYGNGGFHKFVAALLSAPGYNLITARNGADALHKAGVFDGAIHLLLAGVELPGMTGMELAIQLNRQRPDTKILLICGLDSGILILEKDWQFLPHPLMADLLQGRIRDLLSEPEPPDADSPVLSATRQISPGGASSAKTVLLAGGKGIRQSLALALRNNGWHLIGAGSGAEALQKAGEFAGTIHLLVANLDIADMTGTELAQRLNQKRPDTRILLVSTIDSGTIILDRGWHFLPVPFEAGILQQKVLEILEESEQLSSTHAPAAYVRTGFEKLTNREVQMLELIAAGNGTKQAAALLGIAFKTAVGHRSSLMKKLDIHDTAGLVRYAIRAGLIHS